MFDWIVIIIERADDPENDASETEMPESTENPTEKGKMATDSP